MAAIPFRDGLDLYLSLNGVRKAVWRDRQERRDPVQPPLGALRNIVRDLVASPRIILQARRRLQDLEETGPKQRLMVTNDANVLYLRTDHWFDIVEGGAMRHAAGVINGLRRRGHTVRLVSTAALPGVEDIHVCEPIYGLGRNIRNVPLLTYHDQLAAYLAERWDAWRPDFVYQRLSLLSYIGPALRQAYSVPYVCEYNGSALWIARNWDRQHLALSRLALEAERLSLISADLVIAVSEAARAELLQRGVSRERILLSPNGVDLAKFPQDLHANAVRQRLDLAGKLVVGFVGTFGQWHGAEILARAFVALRASRSDLRDRLRLLMIGDGPMRDAVEAILRAGGADDTVILPGIVPQAEIPSHLAACDVLVCPNIANPDGSRFFGSPTKLFEYMAAGRAIVASDLEQIGAVLAHGSTGWLVPPGDAGTLAAGLEVMLDNPKLRKRLGEAARHAAEAEHDWSKRVEAILAALPRARAT